MDTDNGVHAQTVISGLGMCKRMMSGLFTYKLLPKLYVTNACSHVGFHAVSSFSVAHMKFK